MRPETEIEWRIGRNLLVLQRIELNLKTLIVESDLKGALDELPSARAQALAAVSRKTLGPLVKDLGTMSSGAPSEEISYTHQDKVGVHFRHRFEPDDTDLRRLLDQRNSLVHTFLRERDLATERGLQDARDWLDTQHEYASRYLDYLRACLTAVQGSRCEFLEYLASNRFEADFESTWLRQSPLIIDLISLASRYARPDGWTDFGIASATLAQCRSEEIAKLGTDYGHADCESMAQAANVFEFLEESTPEIGRRLLYRSRA